MVMQDVTNNVIRPYMRSSWTPEEDELLTCLVAKHGSKNWALIAQYLDGRIGKQCRERWRNHLDPMIRRDKFTDEEDAEIIKLVDELGTRWARISEQLPGRTENAIKNRYYCYLSRKVSRGKKGKRRARSPKHGPKRSPKLGPKNRVTIPSSPEQKASAKPAAAAKADDSPVGWAHLLNDQRAEMCETWLPPTAATNAPSSPKKAALLPSIQWVERVACSGLDMDPLPSLHLEMQGMRVSDQQSNQYQALLFAAQTLCELSHSAHGREY